MRPSITNPKAKGAFGINAAAATTSSMGRTNMPKPMQIALRRRIRSMMVTPTICPIFPRCGIAASIPMNA